MIRDFTLFALLHKKRCSDKHRKKVDKKSICMKSRRHFTLHVLRFLHILPKKLFFVIPAFRSILDPGC